MINLGNLVLLATNKADSFINEEVLNNDASHINDAFNANSLSNLDHVNGYEGEDTSIENYQTNGEDLDLEVDGDTRVIYGRFKDNGQALKEYTVTVYLLVEELAEVTLFEEEK